MASNNFPTFPSIDFSKLDLPRIDVESVTSAAKDATYVTIGLTVLAFQKAQVARRALAKSTADQLSSSRAQLAEVVDMIEAAAKTGRTKVRSMLSTAA